MITIRRSTDSLGPAAPAVETPEAGRDAPAPPVTERPLPPATVMAPVRLEVYHRLPGGAVLIYVDGEKVKAHKFEGHVKLRKTRFDVRFEVPLGKHRIEVTIAPEGDWGKVLTGQVHGTFTTGRAYRLNAKVGSLGRDLDLEWE